MWSIHRGQKSKHITPTPKRPPLGTPPAAARQLHAQRSAFTVGACYRIGVLLYRRVIVGAIHESPATSPIAPHLPLPLRVRSPS